MWDVTICSHGMYYYIQYTSSMHCSHSYVALKMLFNILNFIQKVGTVPFDFLWRQVNMFDWYNVMSQCEDVRAVWGAPCWHDRPVSEPVLSSCLTSAVTSDSCSSCERSQQKGTGTHCLSYSRHSGCRQEDMFMVSGKWPGIPGRWFSIV